VSATAPAPAPAPGTLYCVPTPIAEGRSPADDLSPGAIAIVAGLDYVVAENAKTARAVLKRLPLARPIQSIEIVELDAHTRDEAIDPMLAPLRAGRSAALMSEAGCPGVADPGARLVLAAHAESIPVVPVVGPSALLLALMGSGLNGQRFAFAGYLPTDADARRQRLRELEQRSRREDETQLFIETPYRNQALADALLSTLTPSTRLCIAADLTGSRQSLRTARIDAWRRRAPVLERVPTVFLFLAG
jgi:16S rRNA (cytidine1402-2'-O)-methyltransferase